MPPQFNFVNTVYQNDNIHVFQANVTKFMSILALKLLKKSITRNISVYIEQFMKAVTSVSSSARKDTLISLSAHTATKPMNATCNRTRLIT
jgi:hypothetical protein